MPKFSDSMKAVKNDYILDTRKDGRHSYEVSGKIESSNLEEIPIHKDAEIRISYIILLKTEVLTIFLYLRTSLAFDLPPLATLKSQ